MQVGRHTLAQHQAIARIDLRACDVGHAGAVDVAPQLRLRRTRRQRQQDAEHAQQARHAAPFSRASHSASYSRSSMAITISVS